MFGVVLWSDKQDRNAVIWCEDHGDLAFCRQDDTLSGISLDAGDWIQFDLATDQQQRVATNPRLVAEGLYCTLADQLVAAAEAPSRAPRRGGAQVVSFESQIRARQERQSCAAGGFYPA